MNPFRGEGMDIFWNHTIWFVWPTFSVNILGVRDRVISQFCWIALHFSIILQVYRYGYISVNGSAQAAVTMTVEVWGVKGAGVNLRSSSIFVSLGETFWRDGRNEK